MISEIGSEFWNILPKHRQEVFLLSGRTALDFIIRDIKEAGKADSALLPSYCCHTMIEPFLRHGMNIRFYDVYCNPDGGLCANIPELKEKEIFYYITYFGFSQIKGIDLPEIRNSASVIIEDKTHSLYSATSEFCDYTYISFRKWSGFLGIAKATKLSGDFCITAPDTTQKIYCNMRQQAAAQKAKYMTYDIGEKESFLSIFAEAEEMLECDYVNYAPCMESFKQLLSFDFEAASARRKANADVLMHRLQNVEGLQLLFPNRQEEDVPLFVPIILKNNRNALRKYLIKQKIYLPVHWPISNEHQGISALAEQIYEHELSLVCDQRYSIDDMERMADLMIRYMKNKHK